MYQNEDHRNINQVCECRNQNEDHRNINQVCELRNAASVESN